MAHKKTNMVGVDVWRFSGEVGEDGEKVLQKNIDGCDLLTRFIGVTVNNYNIKKSIKTVRDAGYIAKTVHAYPDEDTISVCVGVKGKKAKKK